MEILLQVIEEEVNSVYQELLLEQFDDDTGSGSGKGLGRIIDRSNTVGMFLSPVTDIWNAIKFRAAEAGIKAVKTIAQLVAGTISAILPFNDPKVIDDINREYDRLEAEALRDLDSQFAQERKNLDQGWETFKTDFWGIGFVASPMNAIAGLAVGGKALDTAFSVLNVASGGRAERAYNLISGERTRGDIFEAATNQIETEEYEIALEEGFMDWVRGKIGTSTVPTSNATNQTNTEQPKTDFKSLPEKKKKEVLDKLMKNPEVVEAVNQWSTENLPKVIGSVVGNMNKTIAAKAQSGEITPPELANYKAMAPNFVETLFSKMKGKGKKFKVEPPPAALNAASKVVEAEIKSMPVLPAQPQQAPAQPVAQQTQATQPQPVAAGVQAPQPKQ